MRRQKTTVKLDAFKKALDDLPADQGWQTYHCMLVTPMYGGGVEAGKVDKKMPIRASSIRGQLRFWWRIACGPDDPDELFKQEKAIWGGIGDEGAQASQVEIRVKNTKFNGEIAAFEYERREDDRNKYKGFPKANPEFGHAYALFSAQGKLNEYKTEIEKVPDNIAKTDLSFELLVRFKNALSTVQRGEVIKSIRWWASFGGVGSRTRRGLGAIEVKAKDGSLTPVTIEEVEKKGGVLTFAFPNGKQDAVACWKYGCNKLRDFRQRENIGRNPKAVGSKSPVGRSRWPEADSIRNLAKTHSKKHPPNNLKTNFFPRAAFGLPIIFHYQQDNRKGPGHEPVDHTLKVADTEKERMASPLIIRPYHDGKSWKAAALLLPNWEKALTQPLELSPNHLDKPQHWASSPEQQKMLFEKDNPMKGRGDDPLSAFLAYFKEGK